MSGTFSLCYLCHSLQQTSHPCYFDPAAMARIDMATLSFVLSPSHGIYTHAVCLVDLCLLLIYLCFFRCFCFLCCCYCCQCCCCCFCCHSEHTISHLAVTHTLASKVVPKEFHWHMGAYRKELLYMK